MKHIKHCDTSWTTSKTSWNTQTLVIRCDDIGARCRDVGARCGDVCVWGRDVCVWGSDIGDRAEVIHHTGIQLSSTEMMLPYTIVNNNKRAVHLTRVQYYFYTSLLWPVLLYTITIDVITWRIIKKLSIWSLHLRNFLWLSVFALFL